MFELEFKKFLEEQKRGAKGRRLELLEKDQIGEEKMFKEALWPVFQTFEGFIMQYELMMFSGVTMYVDAFYEPLGIAFESEGFVAHAENMTRDRFDFERNRIRSLASKGYIYYPFTWDELSKKPEACKRSLFELLGNQMGVAHEELSLYEREVIKYAALLNRAIRIKDVSCCLGRSKDTSRRVLKDLLSKKLIRTISNNTFRHHEYVLNERALQIIRKKRSM